MSDAELRELRRTALATRDIGDEVRCLVAARRAGVFGKPGSVDDAMRVVSEAVKECHQTSSVRVERDQIASVLDCREEESTWYSDSWSKCVVELRDGRFAYAYESSDSSGHG
jgi:hypothetical protein